MKSELAGPMRDVVYIFEREGERGGGYWWLVLDCGHAVSRKRYVASATMVHMMFRPLSEKLAPKRVQCHYCESGAEKQDPWNMVKAFGKKPIRTQGHTMQTPNDPQQLAVLVEQLRHACSVAFGDLLAQGMSPDVSTGRLLQAAIVAAEECLMQTKTAAPQNKDKVIRDGKVAVLYASTYGWGWFTHNDNLDDSMLFDPEMVAAVEAGDYDAQLAIAKRKWPDAATPPTLSIAWVSQGSRFQLNVHDGEEDVQILHIENWRLA